MINCRKCTLPLDDQDQIKVYAKVKPYNQLKCLIVDYYSEPLVVCKDCQITFNLVTLEQVKSLDSFIKGFDL